MPRAVSPRGMAPCALKAIALLAGCSIVFVHYGTGVFAIPLRRHPRYRVSEYII